MRSLAFIAVSTAAGAIGLACSSFEGSAPPPAEEAGIDGAVGDAGELCEVNAGAFYCSDFERESGSEAGTLFPSPSIASGTNDDTGSIGVFTLDGERVARVDIRDSSHVTERFVLIDKIDSDHLSCSVDLYVDRVTDTESFDVVHFYTTPSNDSPRGLKIELVPKGSGTFVVELHYDIGSGALQLGTMTEHDFERLTLNLAPGGIVDAHIEGQTPAAGPMNLLAPARVDKIAFGLHRQHAATVMLDNVLCTK